MDWMFLEDAKTLKHVFWVQLFDKSSKFECFSSEHMPPIIPNRPLHHITVWLLGDTIAWTLGRIAQFYPTIVPVKQLMPLLCEKLRDVPRVSANICWNVQVVWLQLKNILTYCK